MPLSVHLEAKRSIKSAVLQRLHTFAVTVLTYVELDLDLIVLCLDGQPRP
jgi:hypothetical protein